MKSVDTIISKPNGMNIIHINGFDDGRLLSKIDHSRLVSFQDTDNSWYNEENTLEGIVHSIITALKHYKTLMVSITVTGYNNNECVSFNKDFNTDSFDKIYTIIKDLHFNNEFCRLGVSNQEIKNI